MTGLQPSAWKIPKFFSGRSGRSISAGVVAADLTNSVVRLVDAPLRSPETPIEHRLIAALKKTVGALSFATLVKTVAAELYDEELRKGAAVLDIGLFGNRLFSRDIVRELTAGEGILWVIEKR
jgi:hypothetical protein